MKILVSNDDGYQAPGILVLAEHLRQLGEVTIVAPDRDRSGASNSLTLDSPLRLRQAGERHFAVNGTPTDCVHMAITGLFEDDFDVVVSGINAGANMGDDVIYSGTVAAAMEGRFLGRSALAVSMNHFSPQHYDTAARVVVELLSRPRQSFGANVILNINVPDIPYAELAGMQVTRLGHRHLAEAVVKAQDPRGKLCYWIGPAGAEQDAGPGTDFFAVNNHFVSITPIHVDLTANKAMGDVENWLNGS